MRWLQEAIHNKLPQTGWLQETARNAFKQIVGTSQTSQRLATEWARMERHKQLPNPKENNLRTSSFPIISKNGMTSIGIISGDLEFLVRVDRAGTVKEYGPYEEKIPLTDAFRVSDNGKLVMFTVKPGVFVIDREGDAVEYGSLQGGDHIRAIYSTHEGDTVIIQYSNHLIIDRKQKKDVLKGRLIHLSKNGSLVITDEIHISDIPHYRVVELHTIWIDYKGEKKKLSVSDPFKSFWPQKPTKSVIEYSSDNGEIISTAFIGPWSGERYNRALFYKGEVYDKDSYKWYGKDKFVIRSGRDLIFYDGNNEARLKDVPFPQKIALSDSRETMVGVRRIEKTGQNTNYRVVIIRRNPSGEFRAEECEISKDEYFPFPSRGHDVFVSQDGDTIAWGTYSNIGGEAYYRVTILYKDKVIRIEETNELKLGTPFLDPQVIADFIDKQIRDNHKIIATISVSELGIKKDLYVTEDGKKIKQVLVNQEKY